MDVLMFTRDTKVLQIGSSTEALLKEYASVGKHFVVMVLMKKSDTPAVVRRAATNLWIIPIAAPALFLTPWYAAREARRQLFFQNQLQTDLIDGRDTLLAGLAAWLVAHRFHKPLHLFISSNTIARSYGTESISHFFQMLLSRFLVPAADAISTDSSPIAESLTEVSPELKERMALLPHFIDYDGLMRPSAQDAGSRYPQFKFLILLVAPLVPESNVKLAITLLTGVLRVYQQAGLLIVGSGPQQRELAAYAAHIGVQEHVVFESGETDPAVHFPHAHVLLNTSREPQDETIVAAAAAGCIIVSTHGGLASQLIKTGENGYLCDVSDPGCFVTAITRMIRYPVLRERMKANIALATEQKKHGTVVGRLDVMRKAWEMAVKNFQLLGLSASSHK